MTDYSSLKVPDLKKLLGERSLPISGNKSDLIARLQEHDKKPTSKTAVGTADDEIDWDEDDGKATTAPAAAAVAAGGKGQVSNPVVAPNQKPAVIPVKTKEIKPTGGKEGKGGKNSPSLTEGTVTSAGPAAAEPAPAPAPAPATVAEEAPKRDFAIGIKQTDAEKEAEKRAARAKRFGIIEDEEEKKKLERAKKFGTDKDFIIKGLDDALPERRAKRGREGDKREGRAAKRQTPDRRTEAAPVKPVASKTTSAKAKKVTGRITDDPVEKAKAEARAKRFQMAA